MEPSTGGVMEYAIAILGIIAWPIAVYYVFVSLFNNVDTYLERNANKKVDTELNDIKESTQQDIDQIEAKVLKLQESVTVIQNGLQWKK
jgi:hypothetical protein